MGAGLSHPSYGGLGAAPLGPDLFLLGPSGTETLPSELNGSGVASRGPVALNCQWARAVPPCPAQPCQGLRTTAIGHSPKRSKVLGEMAATGPSTRTSQGSPSSRGPASKPLSALSVT